MKKRRIKHISLAIIKNQDEQILIVKRAKKEKGTGDVVLNWAFPGGEVEDEDYKDAAQREVLEETGYDIEIIKEISSRKHPQFPVFVRYYEGKVLSYNVKPVNDEETMDVMWVEAGELKNYFTTDLDPKVQKYLGLL